MSGTRLTIERMRAEIAAILDEDPAEIGDDDSLIDFGLDSIRAMALVLRWREEGERLEFAELAERPTLSGWWQIASRNRA